MPNNADIAYSLLRREAENMLSGFGFDVVKNPMARMAWEGILNKFNPEIRGFVGLLISEPPKSVDAGCEVVREELGSRVSSFGEKLKKKMNKEQ